MLPNTGFSEQEIIETAEKFLETKKHLEVMKIISLKFLFMKVNCSLPLRISHL